MIYFLHVDDDTGMRLVKTTKEGETEALAQPLGETMAQIELLERLQKGEEHPSIKELLERHDEIDIERLARGLSSKTN